MHNRKKCFEKAEWIGNVYICPECGNCIAVGISGKIYPYKKYARYADQISWIKEQPIWYTQDENKYRIHEFIKNAIPSLRDGIEVPEIGRKSEQKNA